ncbi:MAG: putative acetyltransferase, partial [Colwellia sp.]
MAGCGTLKELNNAHGEIKSMRTARYFLRQGIAKLLMEHMIARAHRF